MQTSPKEQEKLLQQIAVRQASIGKGSAFFNLLFPICIFLPFLALYIAPLMLIHMLEVESDWFEKYSFWSPPVITIAACSLYGFLRRKRLEPLIGALRVKLENGETIN